jgi:predicted DNA-binding transcriptional regulator AlpA
MKRRWIKRDPITGARRVRRGWVRVELAPTAESRRERRWVKLNTLPRARRPRFVKKASRGQIMRDFLPIPEAAATLDVSRQQVYTLIKEKKVRGVKTIWPKSGHRLQWVTRASVERYARERYTK